MKISIRYKFTLVIFLVILIVVIIGVGAGYFLGYGLLRDTIGKEHRNMAQILGQSIAESIKEKIHSIKVYSNSPVWKNSIIESNLKYKAMEAETINRYLLDVDKKWINALDDDPLVKEYLGRMISVRLKMLVEDEITINEIFLTDRFGGLVASSGKTSDFYQADEEWWQGAFDNGKAEVFTGKISFDRSAKAPSLSFVVPVRDDTNEIIGICKAEIDIKAFFGSIGNFKIGKTGHTVLVDKKGYILFHHGIEPSNTRCCSEEDWQKILKSERNWQVFHNPHVHKKEMLMAWANIKQPILSEKKMDWRIFIDQEAEEVFAPLKALLFQAIIVTGFLIIISVPLGFIFGGVVVWPIKKIREAMGHIAKGDLNYGLEVKTGDEIEELADSFKAMASDIKDKQEEIFREKSYAEGIVSSMADMLIVVNPDATIKSVNKAALGLLGYKEAGLIGKNINLIFPEEEKTVFKGKWFGKLTGKGSVHDFEMVCRTKSGENIPVSFTGSVMRQISCPKRDKPIEECPEFKKKGVHCEKIAGIIGVARDMRQIKEFIVKLEKSRAELREFSKTLEEKVKERTEKLAKSQKATLDMMGNLQEAFNKLKETQNQLVQAEKLTAVGQLAVGVAHEINNPLFAISGEAEMLLQDKKKDIDTKNASKVILEQSERIKVITERLLAFSRKRKLTQKPLDINDVVEEAVSLLNYHAKRGEIKIIKKLGPHLPKVFGDKNQLQEVFLTIMLNAVQAMKEEKRLTITTRAEQVTKHGRRETDVFRQGERMVEIEFKDTGCGMDEETLKKMFEPFFSTKEKGTGLGLPVCHGIIKNHRGAIEAHSKVGEGATFVVKLPIGGGGR